MPIEPDSPWDNNLLRAMRSEDLEFIRPDLRPTRYKAGAVLYDPGDHVRTAYFPSGPALACFTVGFSEGKSVETALIGREGAIGGIVSEGHVPAYARCTVQFPGTFLAIETEALEAAGSRSVFLRHLFAHYADCLIAQIFQTTACNAAHTINQRAAKWLVAAVERTDDHDVAMTQEQLARTLGVGRSYVSQVIASFKSRSILETRRGGLKILDFEGLRNSACECNVLVGRHFAEVLGCPGNEQSGSARSCAPQQRQSDK